MKPHRYELDMLGEIQNAIRAVINAGLIEVVGTQITMRLESYFDHSLAQLKAPADLCGSEKIHLEPESEDTGSCPTCASTSLFIEVTVFDADLDRVLARAK